MKSKYFNFFRNATLQWGRPPVADGMFWSHGRLNFKCHASMGPHLDADWMKSLNHGGQRSPYCRKNRLIRRSPSRIPQFFMADTVGPNSKTRPRFLAIPKIPSEPIGLSESFCASLLPKGSSIAGSKPRANAREMTSRSPSSRLGSPTSAIRSSLNETVSSQSRDRVSRWAATAACHPSPCVTNSRKTAPGMSALGKRDFGRSILPMHENATKTEVSKTIVTFSCI